MIRSSLLDSTQILLAIFRLTWTPSTHVKRVTMWCGYLGRASTSRANKLGGVLEDKFSFVFPLSPETRIELLLETNNFWSLGVVQQNKVQEEKMIKGTPVDNNSHWEIKYVKQCFDLVRAAKETTSLEPQSSMTSQCPLFRCFTVLFCNGKTSSR